MSKAFKCPNVVDTVCGTDGKDYQNMCFLMSTSIQTGGKVGFKKYGSCLVDVCRERNRDACKDIQCTNVYEPVVGSDGITYKNLCYLAKANCYSGGNIVPLEEREEEEEDDDDDITKRTQDVPITYPKSFSACPTPTAPIPVRAATLTTPTVIRRNKKEKLNVRLVRYVQDDVWNPIMWSSR